MEEQFNELIQLAKDYKEFGSSVYCKQNWITLYGKDTEVLQYDPDRIGNFTVETYFVDNYETFVVRISIDGSVLEVIDYASKVSIPFDITKDFLTEAIEKLTVVLALWKEYVGVLSKEDIASQRQNEIEVLRARLAELEKL